MSIFYHYIIGVCLSTDGRIDPSVSQVTTVQTEPTDDDGVQNAIDVIYHE